MLNQQQQQALETDGHCLVVACPGSGKTTLITHKIGRILGKSPSHRVVAVTFTRASARELKHRATDLLGEEAIGRARFGTFHSFFAQQLKQTGKQLKIITGLAQLEYVQRAIYRSELDIEIDVAIKMIEHAKSGLDYTPTTESEASLLESYTDILKRYGAHDMMDLAREAYRGVADGSIPPLNVSHMLVDEFQDTDEIQLAWCLHHAKQGTIITVVGDDDQSIYGWRHAMGYDGMQRFASTVGAGQVTMSHNYRCHEEILMPADRLIHSNKHRVSKAMVAARGPGGKVTVDRHPSRDEEAIEVAKAILADTDAWLPQGDEPCRPIKPGRWAVLARNNHQLRAIASELTIHRIPYAMSAGDKNWWESDPLRQLLGLLLAITRGDYSGLDGALHFARLPEEMLSDLHHATRGDMAHLMKGRALTWGRQHDKATLAKLTKILQKLQPWQAQLQQGRFDLVLRSIGGWLAEFCNAPQKEVLETGIHIFCSRLRGPLQDRLTLLTQPRPESRDDDRLRQPVVQLFTMHGAKGLEFDHVWIVGVEDTVIPAQSRAGTSPIDEERRLLYVAMTRAKQRLVLSSTTANLPSFFLEEAGLVAPAS